MGESTPAERTMQARMAAHVGWANRDDRSAHTAPARSTFDARFEREVDPDNQLAPAERRTRAAHARSAYFTGMALKSAQARRRAS